jgi:hypothetical protein
MKRFLVIACAVLCTIGLAGCSGDNHQNFTNIDPSQEYHDSLKGTSSSSAPTNYMDEIKAEVHDELFREETAETLEIVDRIFKHLEVETVKTYVVGNESNVIVKIKTINAGQAWIDGLTKYAEVCASNLFADTYVDDASLYEYYMSEFEDAVRNADYIYIPATIEMHYRNHRWEWKIDDDVVNAITGELLAAIEGDMNSMNSSWMSLFEDEGAVDQMIDTMLAESNQEEGAEVKPAPEVSDTVTLGMVNAVKEARTYLEYSSFSKEGMAKQLRYEGYTDAEIEYALKEVGY